MKPPASHVIINYGSSLLRGQAAISASIFYMDMEEKKVNEVNFVHDGKAWGRG